MTEIVITAAVVLAILLKGADTTEAHEQFTAAFAYMRALLQLEFKSINQQDLRLAIDDLRAVVAATAELCRSSGVDESLVLRHEHYITRAIVTLSAWAETMQ